MANYNVLPVDTGSENDALRARIAALGSALAEAQRDAERYRWAKPILSGDDQALADSRARQLAAGLMAQLDPDAIIDAALKAKEAGNG